MAVASDLLQRARECRQAGDPGQADHLCRQAVQREPGNAEAYLLLAPSARGWTRPPKRPTVSGGPWNCRPIWPPRTMAWEPFWRLKVGGTMPSGTTGRRCGWSRAADIMAFGNRYRLGPRADYQAQTVTLTLLPAPPSLPVAPRPARYHH